MLDYCTAYGIGIIPWCPLAAGELTRPGSLLDAIARSHGTRVGQIALAWLLQRSPVMLPIPGTSTVAHLVENAADSALVLTDCEFCELDRATA